jgi:2-C-methyl-D-erythritol 4-phosphate cytidylyltransferase
MMVSVVVPAAGEGRRMRAPGAPRKQFRELGGEPLLVRTLRVFDRHPGVDSLVVAGPPGEEASLAEALRGYGLGKLHAVVVGGATRQASVGEGLAAVPEGTELVLVHDAVRPFVSAASISAVIAVSKEEGAAALAIPVADTLRRGEPGGTFAETVPREDLWRMQTPQAFRLDLLREAHTRFRDAVGTDEVELVRRLGHPVRVVEGSPFNLKVTTPEDWAFAEAVWPLWSEREGRR